MNLTRTRSVMQQTFTAVFRQWICRAVLASALLPGVLHSAPIRLEKMMNGYSIGLHVEYFEDPTGTVTLDDLLTNPRLRNVFRPSDKQDLGFGMTSSAYWLRFSAVNPYEKNLKWLLEIAFHNLDQADLYVLAGAERKKMSEGDHRPFHERNVKHRFPVFQIVQKPGLGVYYLRAATTSPMNLPLKIWTRDRFQEKIASDQFIFGVLFGLLFIMFIYNMVIYSTVKDEAYLYYSILIIAYIALQLSLSGLGYQHVWPNHPQLSDMGMILNPAALICSILFTRSFLDTRKRRPLLDLTLRGFVVILALEAIVNLFLPVRTANMISHIVSLPGLALLFATGFASLFSMTRESIYYLAAWSAALIGAALRTLKNLAAAPPNLATDWGFELGIMLQLAMFAVGLADKLHRLHTGLEDLVKERTLELHESNAELKNARDALWGEMELAKKLQSALLPDQPSIPGYEIAVSMVPTHLVGGDYYDVITVKDMHWIVIGDVSGHGVPSGLIMMMVQTAIHTTLDGNPNLTPSELLIAINKTITKNIKKLNDEKYMTITVLACSPDGGFTFSGMHQAILIFRRGSAEVVEVETEGCWLGITDDIRDMLADKTLHLDPEDVMLLFTDGITESFLKGEHFELFGKERLTAVFKNLGLCPTQDIIKGINDSLDGYNVKDDVTMVVVRRRS